MTDDDEAKLGREVDKVSRTYQDQVRARRGLELRMRGYTWQDVADHPDCRYYDRSTAKQAVDAVLAQWPREDAAALRDIQLARYERMFRAVYPAAIGEDENGDPIVKVDKQGIAHRKGPDLWSMDRALALMDRITDLSGAKTVPIEPLAVPDGETPAAGRTFADLTGGDPAKARRLARFLHEEGLLDRPRSTEVIEQPGPLDGPADYQRESP